MGEDYADLDRIIELFKTEKKNIQKKLMVELATIIQTNNYKKGQIYARQYGERRISLEKTRILIKFLYDRIIDNPTDVKATDFIKDCKVVFCPGCCPDPEKTKKFSLIEKATVIGKDVQIFICKPCKLVWLSEDIRAENAQDYKKFMKKLGLKGLWKELCDVDVL